MSSGSSLCERNWTGSPQLAWPLRHRPDGQTLDLQCFVACMHGKKNSADHAESGVRRSIQRRQTCSACSSNPAIFRKRQSGRKGEALDGAALVTEPKPAVCLHIPAHVEQGIDERKIPRPVGHEEYGILSVRVLFTTLPLHSVIKIRLSIDCR